MKLFIYILLWLKILLWEWLDAKGSILRKCWRHTKCKAKINLNIWWNEKQVQDNFESICPFPNIYFILCFTIIALSFFCDHFIYSCAIWQVICLYFIVTHDWSVNSRPSTRVGIYHQLLGAFEFGFYVVNYYHVSDGFLTSIGINIFKILYLTR